MNKQHVEKIMATKREKSAAFAQQIIPIDAEWEIRRADEMNWEVRYKGKFNGYFGRLVDAFHALPHKMLHQGVQNSVGEVIERQKAIQASVASALQKVAP